MRREGKMPSTVTPYDLEQAGVCVSKKAAMGLLRRHGILERPKAGKGSGFPWFAQSARVLEVLPGVYTDLYNYFAEGGGRRKHARSRPTMPAHARPRPA